MSAPTQPPGPWTPSPPGPQRGARAPWIIALLASVVAVAALTALVVVVQRDSDDTASERGFDTPEEALTAVIERLADGDGEGAAAAFVAGPLVEGYSFEARAERLRAVTFQSWLPASSEGFDEINERVRRGEAAVELRSWVRTILAPERDPGQTVTLDDGVTAADLAEELSPDALSELSVLRVDPIDREGAAYAENLERQLAVYGADEMQEMALFIDTAEGTAAGGATLVRYGDEWFVWGLTAPLLGIPFAQIQLASEQDYLDLVDSARD